MDIRKKMLFWLSICLFYSVVNVNAQQSNAPFNFSERLKQTNWKLNEQFQMERSPVLFEQNSLVSSGEEHQHSLHQALTAIRKKINAIEVSLALTGRSADTVYLGDTLVIGFESGDELVIDSEWLHPGPILVIGDGVLRFSGAHATILGDIITAENGQVIADSSYLYFPQDYFYQRILLLTGNSEMHFRNSTLDFGGMVHNMATVGTAILELDHVNKPDFSTVGMYEESVIIIDSINVAGEFIIDDDVRLDIKNAETILLWHQMGDGAVADINFPAGEYVDYYEFNDQQSGVSGVGYDILIDNCRQVMWGLMPSEGSDITVTDSDIRAIGLWFEGSDSTEVKGLVNNAYYGDFTAPMQDRNLHLLNCEVMTWSLYSFDNAYVDVSGCILGEIGVMGHSEVSAFNYFCDGSGGYLWAADTTLLVSGMSSLMSALRSTNESMLIFAYSTQMNGLVQALDNSIMMLIQSNISETPTYDPGAVIWMANISGPATGYQNSTVPLEGSAWIDKGSESTLMDFGYYVMYYQKDGDTTWQMIGDTNYVEVSDDVLVNWNTHAVDPGAYYLKLDLWDDWGNGATATAVFTLLPGLLDTPESPEDQMYFSVYPNPARSTVNFRFKLDDPLPLSLKIYNVNGREIATLVSNVLDAGEHRISYYTTELPGGIYYGVLSTGNRRMVKKIVVY